jgi:hypothetical protein
MAQRITRARPGTWSQRLGPPPSLARRWRVKLGHLRRFNNRPPGCRVSRESGRFALFELRGQLCLDEPPNGRACRRAHRRGWRGGGRAG